MNNEILEMLSNKNTDELFFLIGRDLSRHDKTLGKLSNKGLIEKSKVWFELNKANFANKICNNKSIIKLYESEDTLTLITTIGDLIAALVINVPPFNVAYLIYRLGIKNLCQIDE